MTALNDLGPRTPKRFMINSSSASIDAIAAVVPNAAGSPDTQNRALRITALTLSVSGAGTVIFKSGSTEIGRLTFAGAGIVVLNFNYDGWLQTAPGEKFNIGNADTLGLTGFGQYCEL